VIPGTEAAIFRCYPLLSITCKWHESCFVQNRKRSMSFRIDRVVSAENLVVLNVSGRITREHVEMLRSVLEQESGGFAIDLTNVLLVDGEAVKLLALSEANGTELRNCPPYIREWIKREGKET